MLEVSALEFGFDRPLVKGLSFSVPKGQIRLLHGPSGCGKSTLLALISGTPIFDVNWSGEIRLNGIDIGALPAHRRSVGIMYQDPLLFPHLTVLENILIGRHHLYKSPWWKQILRTKSYKDEEVLQRAKVEEVIDFLNLESYRLMPCGILPYGILKRVELARALCLEPTILLLDEPTASLDPDVGDYIRTYLENFALKKNTTILLASHNMNEVERLCNKVMMMKNGKIIDEGTCSSLIKKHGRANLEDTFLKIVRE